MTLSKNQQDAVATVTQAFENDNALLQLSHQETLDAQAKTASVQADFDAYKSAHPDAKSPVTLAGSSINGPLFTSLGYTAVPATRVYLRALPAGSTWNNIKGDTKATNDLKSAVAKTTQILWLSWKESDAKLVDAFLATMPKDLPFEVWGTVHHEPENDLATYSAAQYITEQKAHSPVARKYGLVFATILMRYTFGAGSGRDWKTWVPLELAPYIDVFGSDSYNLGNKKQTYSDVATQLTPIKAAADELGLPWAIGETGASIFGDPSFRAKWAADLMDKATELGALTLCWWDQDSYQFDQATADVWFM